MSSSDSTRAELMQQRADLQLASREQCALFDRTLVLLASGALALSLTFFDRFGPNLEYTLLLWIAWLGFGLALLTTLCSFLLSNEAIGLRIQQIDDVMNQSDDDHLGADERDGDELMVRAVSWANRASYAAFVVGVVGFLAFGIVNTR